MLPSTLISDNIDILLKNTCMKKGELENKLGVAQGYFSKMESSKKAKQYAFSLNTAYNLSKILGISLDNLCSEEFYINLTSQDIDIQIKQLEEKKKSLEQRKEQLKKIKEVNYEL